MINDERQEDISNNNPATSGISEQDAIKKEIDQFLEYNKGILQVENIDGGKRVTFNNLGKTEIVNGISIATMIFILPPTMGSTLNKIKLSLQEDLEDGKYLVFADDKKTIYICDVKHKKIDGNVMEYNTEGKLIFEGEYQDGEKWKGKEYDNGKLIFDGEYKDKKKWKGKEYDKNGKVKEYKNGKLIFEGEYENGKRNGKGKEYHENGNVRFEGKYEKGERNGEGKEYRYFEGLLFEGKYEKGERNGKGKEYDNGKLLFEGEYKNSKRNGEGKEYDENGKVIFEGKYEKGERNGKGKEYDNGKLLFEGEYKNSKRNGEGKEYDNGKLIFEGEYEKGERNGKGKEYLRFRGLLFGMNNDKQLLFEGEYQDGKRNGEGREYNNGKLIFEGKYKNDKKNSKGKEDGKNGKVKEYKRGKLIFEGEYQDGKRNGKGKEYRYYEGLLFGMNNDKHGQGKEYDNEKLIFEGEYQDGKRNGEGREYNNGKLIFEGGYEDDQRNGEGKEYKNGKLIFEGEYEDGERNCEGKEYDKNGNLIFEGEYKDGKKWIGKEYDNGKLIFEGKYKNGKKWIGKEYDNGKLIFKGKYKNGKKWIGEGKIYIKTTNGNIEKECKYDKGKKDGYEVRGKCCNGRNVIIKKYQNGKAVEESFYVNGEECSKVKLTEDGYAYTDSTKTNYGDTNVVVYGIAEDILSDNTREIRDKFGEKTQLLTKRDLNDEPDDDIKIADGTNKLELFINFHGIRDIEEHPISLHDIRPISNKVSNAIVSSNGQIQTLTIKLVNCYGRTYDMNGNDLKAELLKDIYTKALEQAEGKELDLNTLPTILISGATIDSAVITKRSTNETKKGCKRIAKKEYFSFNKENWKTVAKIIKEHEENNKDGNNKNTINDKNDKMDKELNDKLISLFKGTDKKNYRNLKGYYNNRDNINNKETNIENKKGNSIGNV